MTKPMEIELPVCAKCGRVGKLPFQGMRQGVFKCTGSGDNLHKVQKMEIRKFVEVRDD